MANLLILYWGRRGGGAHYAAALCNASFSSHDINVYTSFSSTGDMASLVRDCSLWQTTYRNTIEFIVHSLFLPIYIIRLIVFCYRRKIDVVFVPMRHLWSPIINPLLSMNGIPVIHCVHDAVPHPGENHPLWAFFLRVETRFARTVVTFSESVYFTLKEKYGIAEEKMFRSKLPVFSFPAPIPERRSHEKGWQTTGSGVRFLFFGRLAEYKGLPLLIEAFEGLGEPAATLTIAGAGELAAHIKRQVRQNHAINFAGGWLSDLQVGRLLASHDVMLLPYTEASQSGAIMAALGAGMPCIITPVGGLVEQIVHGRTGLIAAEVSAKAVQDEMRKLCQDAGMLRQLQNGASDVQHSIGSWRETVEELARLINDVGGRPG